MVVGVVTLWLVVAAAVRVRRFLAPAASRAGDAVADTVLALLVVTTIGQLAGAFGLFRGEVIVGCAVLVFAATVRFVPVGPSRGRCEPLRPAAIGVGWLLAAAGALAVVGAQWTAHLAHALRWGMVQPDTLWFHGPFAATIRQTGGFGSFGQLGYPESRFSPLNTHVVDAMLAMPTGTDVLVPFVNHVHAALLVVGAYVIGRRFGAASPAVAVAAVVLGLPLVVATQPGQMYNDVAATSLLVAAAALYVGRRPVGAGDSEGGWRRCGAELIALAALGLAVSTKLTVAAPAAVLGAGIVVGLVRRRERVAAAVGAAVLAVTGGVWFVRNLVLSGSPAPYAELAIGPVGFDRQTPDPGRSIVATLGDLRGVGRYYLDSLDVSFGPVWWLVVGLAVIGAVAGVVMRTPGVADPESSRDVRLVAVAALAGLVVYPFVPLTGDFAFVNNLRYAVPSLALALVVAAVRVARLRWGAHGAVAIGVGVVGVDALSGQRGRIAAWPGEMWPLTAALGVAAGLAVAITVWPWRSGARQLPRSTAPLAAVVVSIVAIAIVPSIEDSYLDGRYTGDELDDAWLYRAMASVGPVDAEAPVDVIGVVETYPLFGEHLERRVEVHDDLLLVVGPDRERCAAARKRVSREEPGFIVIGSYWTMPELAPAERFEWFERDAGVEVVAEAGAEAVLRRDAPLDSASCLPAP